MSSARSGPKSAMTRWRMSFGTSFNLIFRFFGSVIRASDIRGSKFGSNLRIVPAGRRWGEEPPELRGSVRDWSRGHGQGHRRAPQELAKEVQGRTPLLPARPPHRHQHRLRSRAYPGPAATPDLAQNDAKADRQLGPPVGGVQPRLAQEGGQVAAMGPQVLGQALVGRVRLGREDQIGQLVPTG